MATWTGLGRKSRISVAGVMLASFWPSQVPAGAVVPTAAWLPLPPSSPPQPAATIANVASSTTIRSRIVPRGGAAAVGALTETSLPVPLISGYLRCPTACRSAAGGGQRPDRLVLGELGGEDDPEGIVDGLLDHPGGAGVLVGGVEAHAVPGHDRVAAGDVEVEQRGTNPLRVDGAGVINGLHQRQHGGERAGRDLGHRRAESRLVDVHDRLGRRVAAGDLPRPRSAVK